MQHLSLIWVVVIVGIIFWKIRLFAHAFDEVSNALLLDLCLNLDLNTCNFAFFGWVSWS